MKELSIMEQLCFSTVRIETSDANNNYFSGTGFFLRLDFEEIITPCIVTNKHVVKGMTKGKFIMTVQDSNGDPNYRKHYRMEFDENFEQSWIFHPDPKIDLCIMLYNPLIEHARNTNKKELFHKAFNSSDIPQDKNQWNEIDVAEEVLMIGYPNGLWDSVNNMPLIRKGIVATNVCLDHNGKREFVIDAACFPGSSGSPVVVCNSGGYKDKQGNLRWGESRLKLLGILYAGPQLTVTGDVEIVTIPTAQKKVQSVSHIPNNLGYIIKADVLLDFIPILKRIFNL